MGPFRFRVTLFYIYIGPFTNTWGPFTPMIPLPVEGFGGGVQRL